MDFKKMKKIYITICLFVGLLSFSKAQGNLQFNRVRLEQITLNPSGSNQAIFDSFQVIVPSNKVLKIESAHTADRQTYDGTYADGTSFLSINKIILKNPYNTPIYFPVWLPAGTYYLRIEHPTCNKATTFYGTISAIEYNIVP